MNVKVSIVIPVYDSEAYLDRAMILVDDGSTDSSPSICDSYRDRYPDKVRVIHKENGGLTSAWKAGSLVAVGEYTGYIDSDDTIAEDMFERLYERAADTDADIVCCHEGGGSGKGDGELGVQGEVVGGGMTSE